MDRFLRSGSVDLRPGIVETTARRQAMSRMLNFHEAGWATARDCAVAGRRKDALAALTPLLRGMDAPERLVLSAHRLAARLHYAESRFRKARIHLRIAHRLDSKNSEIAFELGQAWERDPLGSDRRALRWYRMASRLTPESPKHLAAYGRSLVRADRVRLGCRKLRHAAAKVSSEAFVLQCLVDGFREAGRPHEAYRTAAKARFLAPKSTEIQAIWIDVNLGNKAFAPASRPASLLPFTPPAGIGPRLLRHGPATAARPRFLRLHG